MKGFNIALLDDQSCLKITNMLIVICRKHRQKRNVTLIALEALLQWLNLVFYVVPNALNVANPCFSLADDWFYLGFARWTCWNTVSHLSLRSMQCRFVLLANVSVSMCLPLGSCCLARALHVQHCAAMRSNHKTATLGWCWSLKAAQLQATASGGSRCPCSRKLHRHLLLLA